VQRLQELQILQALRQRGRYLRDLQTGIEQIRKWVLAFESVSRTADVKEAVAAAAIAADISFSFQP
jgi:hypothetical protein